MTKFRLLRLDHDGLDSTEVEMTMPISLCNFRDLGFCTPRYIGIARKLYEIAKIVKVSPG